MAGGLAFFYHGRWRLRGASGWMDRVVRRFFLLVGPTIKLISSCVYIYFGTQFEPHNHIFSGTEGVYFYETIFQDEFINITFTFSNLIQ